MTLPWWLPEVGARERELLDEVLASNFLNDGEYTTRFEDQLAALVGCRHVVGVTSGTAALYLSLAALGIGPGDEVIVPDITFIASANAVRLAQAEPVLVDIDPTTLNVDPAAVEAAITTRTRAIMPVHVSGRAADMPRLLEIADRHGIAVVEDAAEGLWSKRFGKYLGTHGALGCVSFSPNKTVTTGQGGAVFTDDDELHRRLRQLKDQGRPLRGTGGDDPHPEVGFNFKLTNLQAAIGLAQLERLPARADRMRTTYRQYRQLLDGCPGITFPGFVLDEGELPQWVDVIAERRDELVESLSQQGMDCRPFWLPIHTQPPYSRPAAGFPNASRLAPKAVWLPSAFTLRDGDVAAVAEAIRRFYGAG